MGQFEDLFTEANLAFDGLYKTELNKLVGLSRDEVDAVTPGTEDLRVYSVLIKVVEKASKENISKAQLAANIRELGDVAVSIAKKITELAKLLT